MIAGNLDFSADATPKVDIGLQAYAQALKNRALAQQQQQLKLACLTSGGTPSATGSSCFARSLPK
jgi:hypothetical protein